MKSFIVTFYRHGGKEDPAFLFGTVEEAGMAGVKKFTSLEELYGLLGSAAQRKKKGRKRADKRRSYENRLCVEP